MGRSRWIWCSGLTLALLGVAACGESRDGEASPASEGPCAGRGGDADDDDVCQVGDNCPDTPNADQRDADGDGIGDACDDTPDPCDDHGGDADEDTICTFFDNCPETFNPTQLDRDLDGIGDACDPTPPLDPADEACAGVGGDDDGDNWCGLHDNCPFVANPDQRDTDGDGIGDACDEETCDGIDNDGDGEVDEGFTDGDGDGVADCVDVCPGMPDDDGDGDGVADCIDACPFDPHNDEDGDGVCGDEDNCPRTANHDQADEDGDGIGDRCDVEECDGVDNDGDGRVDEGLPDADEDGVCDAIDPCPGDTINDPDDDDLCGEEDNCPYAANPDQTDTDGDGFGDACDLDAECEEAAALNDPGAVELPSTLETHDVVADPTRPVLYVSVAVTDPSYPNQVLAIDGATGSILWGLPAGGEPGPLAVADDGSRLYLGYLGAALVRLVDLDSRRACKTFALGHSTFWGPLYAREMVVPEGAPQTVVVSTQRTGVSADFGGLYVYDNGHRRPEHVREGSGPRQITGPGPVLYGYNDSSTEYGFRELMVDEHGVTEVAVHRDVIRGFDNDILFEGGLVFGLKGEVVDPGPAVVIGTFPSTGPVAPATELGRVYMATAAGTIRVFDLDTYLEVDTIDYTPGDFQAPREIVRWGNQGLAVRTDSSITTLDGVIVMP
ncbi:MAG: thrombospondin type 3 repeat-containing protein [Myxococcota bacterium]